MANAIEAALNRASPEQQARNQQVIEEARRNIQLVSDRTPEQVAAQQAQTIEEAKQNIPFDTMKDVDEVSSPLPTPTRNINYDSKVINLHPDTIENIEGIEQGGGNNYLNENAVDRAQARQDHIAQEQARYDRERQDRERQEQQAMER
jgi:hypothetical protein